MANGEKKNGNGHKNGRNGANGSTPTSNGAPPRPTATNGNPSPPPSTPPTNGERRDAVADRVGNVLESVRTRERLDVSDAFKGDVRDAILRQKNGRGRGRPSIYDVNPEKIIEEAEKFAILGLPQREMAWWWGVCEDTVSGWKERHPEFSEALKRGDVGRKVSLLGAMHHNAIIARVPSIQIFLAKNVLGYKDVIEVPPSNEPMRIQIVRATAAAEKK